MWKYLMTKNPKVKRVFSQNLDKKIMSFSEANIAIGIVIKVF